MTDERFHRVEELFLTASQLQPDQRAEFLDGACADDASLRAEVEGLLAQDVDPHELMKTLAFGKGVQRAAEQALDAAAATESESLTPSVKSLEDALPYQIGPYRIIRALGEGGMGVVYLGRQTKPIRRQVALKVIKLGMDTKRVIARFESERQALAMLSHPNVARILDAGATEGGRPYFVMEYVEGTRITDYCDEHRLTVRQRLDLFVAVCQAIQHAHQKGIIHRDIKPANVLVAEHDGKPVPKVIDFGIAKATEQRLTEETLVTQQGHLVGTPEYMSPEQAGMPGMDIDTRTDVYSLGVLLYELLVGALPFDPEHLRQHGLSDIQRIICEEDPPRPSTRLSTLKTNGDGETEPPDPREFAQGLLVSAGHSLEQVALNRRIDPPSLRRLLRGDLDSITLKALEKDRARRYESVADLAGDIQRHLNDEPIVARPPDTWQRLRKYCRRHRGLVTGVAAVLVVLVAGIVASTAFALKERRQRRLATWQTYRLSIAAADASLRVNDVAAAHQSLTEAPQEFRDWEWRYLDAQTDQSVGALRGHDAPVWCVAVSPDGRRLASASEDRTIVVWNLDDRRELARLKGHTGTVYSVAFSGDGKRLVSGSIDATVRVWDVADGRMTHVLQGHTDGVLCVAFSPDGRQVLSGSIDQTLRIWDLDSGEDRVLPSEGGNVYSLVFNPSDDDLLAIATFDRRIRFLNVATGEFVREWIAHDEFARNLAFSPDGRLLASASVDGSVRLWDPVTTTELDRAKPGAGPVQSVAFSPDGTRLLTGSDDQTMHLWGVSADRKLEPVAVMRGHRGIVQSVAFLDGSTAVSAARTKTHNLLIWDVPDGPLQKVFHLRHDRPPQVLGFNQSGTRLACVSPKSLHVWNVSEDREEDTVRADTRPIVAVTFEEPNAGLVVAWGNGDSETRTIQVEIGDRLVSLPHDARVRSVTVSPRGTRMATLSGGNDVRIWDWSTGRELGRIDEQQDSVAGLFFAPRGDQLALRYANGAVALCGIGDGRVRAHLQDDDDRIVALAWSGDGSLVATGMKSGRLCIWRAITGEKQRAWSAHDTRVQLLGFSPSGRRLASVGMDERGICLWDVETGDRLLELRAHTRPVVSLAFSPDGNRLASGAQDHTVRLWEAVPYRDRRAELRIGMAR